jgi:ferredoxin, 2Fe-2S
MAIVRLLPLDVELTVNEGESVMDAAERAGYRWPTLCGGVGMCTMCWVRIDDQPGHASPMGALERNALETLRWDEGARPEGNVRLACQLRVSGPLTVFKRGVNVAGRAGVYR